MPQCTERDSASLKVWVPVHPQCTERESPSLKEWVPGHPRHSVKRGVRNSSLKTVGVRAPIMSGLWVFFFWRCTVKGKSNHYLPIDLNNGNMHWFSVHTYCDVPWHPKSNCKLIRFTLHDWNKFSLINESEAQPAPYYYVPLWSSHDHQTVRKCTWTWWPVSTEWALCFSKNNVASDYTVLFFKLCFILWKPKNDFSAQLCLNCQYHCMHHLLAFDVSPFCW